MDGTTSEAHRQAGRCRRRAETAPPVVGHHAGAFRQRQARLLLGTGLIAAMTLLAPAVQAAGEGTSPPESTAALPPGATGAAAAMREARERRLQDEQLRRNEQRLRGEQRAVEGRIQSLDRQLAPWERQQQRARTIEPDGLPTPLQNPTAERLDLERRGLRDRDRLLEQQIRNEQADRARIERIRKW